ncbi:MAG: DeoR/GlpR family DNA-binding transcription regulator [Fretibacterium sp.]|nr:DeoR/GlpR family DNA-binding transcription regulator [Fretibacterium sp.]
MQRRAHPSILPAGRQRKILDVLRSEGAVTVDDLVSLLGVSESTVRRDLEQLSERGLLSRTHGGAVPPSISTAFENAYADKKKTFVEEKVRIGGWAASYVADGDTLILDAGSTTLEIARQLSEHRRLTVLTYDFAIAGLSEYHPTTSVFLAGGSVRRDFNETLGADAESFFRDVRVNKAFLGADAIDLEQGVFNANIAERAVKQLIIRAAQEVVLVADHSKFGKSALVRICGLTEIDKVVTDRSLAPEFAREMERQGISFEAV